MKFTHKIRRIKLSFSLLLLSQMMSQNCGLPKKLSNNNSTIKQASVDKIFQLNIGSQFASAIASNGAGGFYVGTTDMSDLGYSSNGSIFSTGSGSAIANNIVTRGMSFRNGRIYVSTFSNCYQPSGTPGEQSFDVKGEDGTARKIYNKTGKIVRMNPNNTNERTVVAAGLPSCDPSGGFHSIASQAWDGNTLYAGNGSMYDVGVADSSFRWESSIFKIPGADSCSNCAPQPFATGFRNPYGMAINNGLMFVSENAPQSGAFNEELNIVPLANGGHYGFPNGGGEAPSAQFRIGTALTGVAYTANTIHVGSFADHRVAYFSHQGGKSISLKGCLAMGDAITGMTSYNGRAYALGYKGAIYRLPTPDSNIIKMEHCNNYVLGVNAPSSNPGGTSTPDTSIGDICPSSFADGKWRYAGEASSRTCDGSVAIGTCGANGSYPGFHFLCHVVGNNTRWTCFNNDATCGGFASSGAVTPKPSVGTTNPTSGSTTTTPSSTTTEWQRCSNFGDNGQQKAGSGGQNACDGHTKPGICSKNGGFPDSSFDCYINPIDNTPYWRCHKNLNCSK